MSTLVSMGTEIRLPQLELLPWGLFTDVVPEIDVVDQGTDRAGLGGKWVTRDGYTVTLETFDCITDDNLNEEITLDPNRETLPFMQSQIISCSTVWVGMDFLNEYLTDDARMTRSAALVEALTTQISVDHINLVDDSTALAASTDVTEAVALVEEGLAGVISNGRGHIFVPPGLLAYVMGDVVALEGGRLVSPRGHWVISDSGHTGTTVYGTGALGWSMTEVQRISGDLGVFEFSDNTQTGAYTRYGVVFFNPAHSVKTAVTLP